MNILLVCLFSYPYKNNLKLIQEWKYSGFWRNSGIFLRILAIPIIQLDIEFELFL